MKSYLAGSDHQLFYICISNIKIVQNTKVQCQILPSTEIFIARKFRKVESFHTYQRNFLPFYFASRRFSIPGQCNTARVEGCVCVRARTHACVCTCCVHVHKVVGERQGVGGWSVLESWQNLFRYCFLITILTQFTYEVEDPQMDIPKSIHVQMFFGKYPSLKITDLGRK